MSDVHIDPEVTEESPADDDWDAALLAALESAYQGTTDEPELEDIEPELEEVEPEPEPEVEPEAPSAFYEGIPDDRARQMLEWVASLDDEQVQKINAALAPEPTAAASGHGTPAPTAPADGAGDALPDMPDLSLLAEAVPGFAEYLAAVDRSVRTGQTRIDSLGRQQASLADIEAKRNRAATDAAIDAGIEAFREANPLSDTQFDSVMQRATDLQVLPSLVTRFNGDVSAAMQEALGTAMWSDPNLREELVQYRLNAIGEQQVETKARKQRAASLSGGSGSVPGSRTSAAPVTLTPEQHRDAMVQKIAAEINGRVS